MKQNLIEKYKNSGKKIEFLKIKEQWSKQIKKNKFCCFYIKFLYYFKRRNRKIQKFA